MVRNSRYKLVEFPLPEGGYRRELFDVESDSAELNDISTERPDVLRELGGHLDQAARALPRYRPALLSQEEVEAVPEIVSLRVENETLRRELSVAKNKLSDTITEFGDMFGGGKDHQLSLHEVVERIDAMKADNDPGEPLKAQK